MSYNKRKLKGFLLAEVLVASFVLIIGLLATSALITTSLRNSFDNRDSIIAIELAQEGIELVRNVRDNNFISGGTGFAAFSNSTKHCRIDYNDSFDYLDAATVDPNVNCNSSVGPASRYYLQYNSGTGFYEHGSSQEKFSRYIYIDYNVPGPGSENALVRSFVYWGIDMPSGASTTDCNLANKCVFTEVTLTNWN